MVEFPGSGCVIIIIKSIFTTFLKEAVRFMLLMEISIFLYFHKDRSVNEG
ncbi:hypothetical protein ES705_43596 [subsurface metagenome]